jgi:hypothetical protein
MDTFDGDGDAGAVLIATLERKTIVLVAKRVLPFIFLCYFCCLVDRVNLSFAALTMNKDLSLSTNAYSFGASSTSSLLVMSSLKSRQTLRSNASARGCGSHAS